MKRIYIPTLLLLITAFLLTSCRGAEPTPGVTTDAAWERIQKNGKIVVGTSMDYPPFEYVDTKFQADGFDIGMITAIGQQLGLPMDVKNYAFNGLYNALQTGQIDIAVSAIAVTPEREQKVLFSNVYLTNSAAAVAPPGSPIVISSPAQLPAYRVGVQKGSAFESYMNMNFIMTGLMPATQLYTFINMDDEIANLVANKIDIALMDQPTAEIYIPKNNLKLAGTGVAPQRYAIAMPLNSPVLQANINSALKTLNNNGTLGKLTKQYLSVNPDTVLPPSCVDDMAFVADVTYPDNNMKSPPVLTPGQVFVKTWRVKNSGTCSWVPGYRLVYTYGNTPAAQMGGQPVQITAPVSAGQTVDLSVTLTAPKSNGTYQGFWQMNNANKQAFGQTIWVGITVADPAQPTAAPVPAPVITTFTVTPGQIQLGQCVTANWVVQGAVDRVVFERNGEDLLPYAPVSGSYADCPPISGQVQYALGAYGPGGKQIVNVYITVAAPTNSNI